MELICQCQSMAYTWKDTMLVLVLEIVCSCSVLFAVGIDQRPDT